jgi:hypothetical protein
MGNPTRRKIQIQDGIWGPRANLRLVECHHLILFLVNLRLVHRQMKKLNKDEFICWMFDLMFLNLWNLYFCYFCNFVKSDF